MKENETYAHYKMTIDNISKGIAVPNIPIFVTYLPHFGVKELDGARVEVTPRTIQKIMAGYLEEQGLLPTDYSHDRKHYLSLDDVLEFPKLLARPLEIVRSSKTFENKRVDGFLFFTDRFEEKPTENGVALEQLGIVLHIRGKGKEKHLIVSSYGFSEEQKKSMGRHIVYEDVERKELLKKELLKDSMLALRPFKSLPPLSANNDRGAISPSEANSADEIPSRHVPESGESLTDRPPLSYEDVNRIVEDWQVGDSKEEKKALVLFVAEQLEPEEGEEMLNTKGIFVEAITLMQIKNALRDEMKTQLYDELVKDKEQEIGGR